MFEKDISVIYTKRKSYRLRDVDIGWGQLNTHLTTPSQLGGYHS